MNLFRPLAMALILLPSLAHADAKRDLGYTYDAIWSTAVRYIRVDKRFPLGDKDKDTGYIFFTYPGSGAVKACPASLELIRRTNDEGYLQVRVQLTIAHQPAYVELQFLNGLVDKLGREQGVAPPPRKAPSKNPPPRDDPKDKAPPKKSATESREE